MTTRDVQIERGSDRRRETFRLVRMFLLLVAFVLGGRYLLGLPTFVAIVGGATCALVVALLINRVLSRRRSAS